MKKILYVATLLVACKGSDATKQSAKPSAQPSTAADPWAKKSAADIKDPKLARLDELAANGPGKDKFPQADAIFALEQDEITYKGDGTVVTKHHSIVKLLDPQRGKDKYADLHIEY